MIGGRDGNAVPLPPELTVMFVLDEFVVVVPLPKYAVDDPDPNELVVPRLEIVWVWPGSLTLKLTFGKFVCAIV